MSYIKKHKEGILLTTLFHVAIILLLLKLGFFTELPLPDDKGVLVDFGISQTGQGRVEPPKKTAPKVENTPQQQVPEPATPPEPVSPEPTPVEEPSVQDNAEDVMTQDFEEAAEIAAAKKKKEDEDQKKRLEEERKRQEELDKQIAEEKERKRQEDIERQKREAREKEIRDSIRKVEEARIAEQRRQDSIKRAKEQAKINAIDNMVGDAFGGASTSDNSSQGQGVTYGPGNQGVPTGSANANVYSQGGGEGISFNLVGRSSVSLPKPTYPGQEEGTVVVSVTVDKYGNVTNAEPGVRGSTSLNSGLLNAAKNAALSAKFDKNPNAPALQTGTITYKFVLN